METEERKPKLKVTVSGDLPGVRIEQYPDRESWLEARRGGIGASEIAALIGCSPWAGPYKVYCAKEGLDEITDNPAMEWGRRLEAAVAEKFADETSLRLEDPGPWTIFRSIADPRLFATPDRIVVGAPDTEGPPIRALVEIKSTNARNLHRWENGIPEEVEAQVQYQMGVVGLSQGFVAVLIGGQEFRWMPVKADPAEFEAMKLKVAEFYESHLIPEEPPPADELPGMKRLLAKIYPNEDPASVVELDGGYIAVDEELQALKDRAREIKALVEVSENKIRQAIGGHEFAVLPNGVRYRWHQISVAEKVVKAYSFRRLGRQQAKG